MPRSPITDQASPRTGALLRRLGLAGVLIALAATPATAIPKPNRPTQSATSGQTASAPVPTTVVRETVVKSTNSHPALPIALSAAALAVALGAAAHTLIRHNHTRA
jgi:hypothetical protein